MKGTTVEKILFCGFDHFYHWSDLPLQVSQPQQLHWGSLTHHCQVESGSPSKNIQNVTTDGLEDDRHKLCIIRRATASLELQEASDKVKKTT